VTEGCHHVDQQAMSQVGFRLKESDRRQSVEVQIAFYRNQARLVRMGLVTRRSEAFFLRQVEYLKLEPR
jgi:hypothetical protein